MKIRSVKCQLPSRTVTNEEIVSLIRTHSTTYAGDFDRDCQLICKLLERTGLKTRRWASGGETAFEHLSIAVNKTLQEASLNKTDIDLIIYVGVSKGFVEPANAYLIARDSGFHRSECFDITDACMSWARALNLVDSLFKTGDYTNAMIVNAEFNLTNNNYGNYRLGSRSEIEYSMPGFTIGEAATATIVSKSPDLFVFRFHSKPELADKCMIPTKAYKSFCGLSVAGNMSGVEAFTSYGKVLHDHAGLELPKVIDHIDTSQVDIVFTHASSKTDWQEYCDRAGLGDKVHHIYHETGNLVSASIPAAMDSAIMSGRLKRGDRVLCWVGSAGMSFASIAFIF